MLLYAEYKNKKASCCIANVGFLIFNRKVNSRKRCFNCFFLKFRMLHVPYDTRLLYFTRTKLSSSSFLHYIMSLFGFLSIKTLIIVLKKFMQMPFSECMKDLTNGLIRYAFINYLELNKYGKKKPYCNE